MEKTDKKTTSERPKQQFQVGDFVVHEGRVSVFIVVASGQSFATEVKVAKSLEKARGIARGLFEDLQLDGGDCEEVSTDEWMGYSKRADCVVRISIHEREV